MIRVQWVILFGICGLIAGCASRQPALTSVQHDEASLIRHQVEQPADLTAQAAAASAAGVYLGTVIDPPVTLQDFALPGTDLDIERLSDLNGTWLLMFFGYLHCPDFCPLTLAEYRRIKADLGADAENIRFVYISVDAVRDSPDAIRAHLANFDPAFIGFSGDDDTLARIQPDYGFYYERRMDTGSQAVYTVDHSTRSYLVDRQGILRASFTYDAEHDAIAEAIRWYLQHEN